MLKGDSKTERMKKERIRWMLAIGLLGLLGFSSCSPRLRPRKVKDNAPDTLFVPLPDTLKSNPGDLAPIKLMYGVPPTRFEQMQMPEKELK